jgi:hypothetical protein
MKRIFIGVLAAFVCTMAGAQNAIPNASFEQWNVNPNYDDPVGWGTINSLTYVLGVRTVTKATGADAYGGFAMKLESKTVPFQGVAPGIAATGTINASTQAVDGGVPFNKRPAALKGWFKYQPNGVDTGSIEANLFRWNAGQREQVGRAEFQVSSTVNSYTQFTANFTYTSANAPDTLVMILLSSSGANASPVGTKLFVDSLTLDYCSNFSLTPSSTPTICTASTGSASVTTVNGESTFTYAWSGGGSGATISNKAAGNYTVTVTDANSCVATAAVTVSSTNTAVAITPSATTTACGSNTGTATATPTSGSMPYDYLWGGGQTSQTISNLGAGSYNVTVTDANGCSGTASASVTTPNGPSATAAVTNVACFGGSTGNITVTVTGGASPYTYVWNITPTPNAVPAGTYIVTVTDANSCQFILTTTVTEPALLSATTNVTNVACFGGSTGAIVVNVSGGTAAYMYTWSDGGNGSNLAADSYTVTITDANSCVATATAVVTEPTVLASTSSASDALCFNSNTGSIQVTAAGGTPPYTYTINGNAASNPFNSLTAGSYMVVVKDANNCTSTENATISEPAALAISLTVMNASAPNATDGSASADVTGGTVVYTYAWNTTPPQTTANATALPPGNYCVTVTDDNGCSISDCETISAPNGISRVNSVLHRIYPNPVSDVFSIESEELKGTTLRLFAVDGSLKLEQLITTDSQQVSVTDLPQGVYTYKVSSPSNVELVNGRIVISR